jgi:IS30 family transposase
VEWISDEAKARIAELWAEGASAWRMREETGVSRHAVLRQVRRLRRQSRQPKERSPLRLSFAEREEISRGLAAGESMRTIAGRLGRAPSTITREVTENGAWLAIEPVPLIDGPSSVLPGRSHRSWRAVHGCG